jgi:hypothetical protein
VIIAQLVQMGKFRGNGGIHRPHFVRLFPHALIVFRPRSNAGEKPVWPMRGAPLKFLPPGGLFLLHFGGGLIKFRRSYGPPAWAGVPCMQ